MRQPIGPNALDRCWSAHCLPRIRIAVLNDELLAQRVAKLTTLAGASGQSHRHMPAPPHSATF